MADKSVNELNYIDSIAPDDLVPVYDIGESGDEKLKKVPAVEFMVPRYPSDGMLQISSYNGLVINFGDFSGTPKVRVTAFELIKSVHAADGLTLTYGISKTGETWVTGTDPKAIYVDYVCADMTYIGGLVLVSVRVSDGTNMATADTYIMLYDNHDLCGPPAT